MSYESRYDNWIGGERVAPVRGQYFENPSPVTGRPFCEVARSTAEDVELALDAAHAAAPAWGRTAPAERSVVLNRIADRIEANLEKLAVAETWDNGKAVRECLAADLPLVVDHWRYFAGVLRGQEGSLSQINEDTAAYHFEEPLGVVAQIIPWNFPILMATWKLAPALAAGNAVVLKLNQGEVCTCPSRGLVQQSIYDRFMADAEVRVKAVVQGNPLDTDTMMGAQASSDQLEKILSYFEIGRAEGAKVRTGGERVDLGGDLTDGYYVAPTIFEGNHSMRVLQEEIFGPVVSVTPFRDYDHAIEIANDTLYGLGAGVWSRNGSTAYRAGRDIQAGRVWTNCYHDYPAHAAFGGYKSSGIGRENHLMMLDHHQQTKNLLVNYSAQKLGFF